MTIPNLNIIKRIWNKHSGIGQRRLALKKEQIKEGNMETHRVMVTVTDPNHTMQTQRKTKIMKRVKVKANDRDHAIDSAIHHYKKAGYKVHDHEYLGRVHEEVEFIKAEYIEEGLGRGREDDEYHVPDPATTHKITHKVSHPNVEGGREHNRTVTISNSTKTTDQARKLARAHLEKQGYKIHEETEIEEGLKPEHNLRPGWMLKADPKLAAKVKKNKDIFKARRAAYGNPDAGKSIKEETDACPVCGQTPCNCTHITEGAYEKAEENKKSADAAKKQGDMFAHHLHMADHHDNMAQWHSEKGRHGEADRHAEKSEKHHEEAMKLKEEVAANNVGNGNIAGTQGDAGKKPVMTKEPLKRKSLKDMREECNCWKGYKRKPGTKPCEDGSCVKEESELDEAAVDGKGHKSSTGGLTQKGRDYYNNKTGGNLQAPVTTPPSKLDPDSKAAKRRKSFCARMSGVDGPMKDEKGRPTRKALALRKWNC